jgi:two-component system, NtrC family, response regulator GlrR
MDPSTDPVAPKLSGTLIGASPAFQTMWATLRRISASDAPVLIEGETGCGKELAARAIHYDGARRAGPFVPINCGALPDHLLEAELFGHERGAYTDAKFARRGLVAEANGGTLFFDEVDALSAKAQVTLLRFLQDQRYRPLGSNRELTTDVRVLAATNRSLDDAAAQGQFRIDLMYRLKILHLELPSLAAREGDAVLLARHFLATFSAQYRLAPKQFDVATLDWVRDHHWRGNVRELENWVHRACLMAEGPTVGHGPAALDWGATTAADAPAGPAGLVCQAGTENFQHAKATAMQAFERDYVVRVLSKTQGNVTRAAAIAGKERRAFGKLLKKHGIDRTGFSG